ncbi:MlaE family lipid ABC transporter permease subunit [Jiella endophytica]|uniref:MlaE family lipid ABC transporter permease subunit n=1 Tax=Jiella endophytica TaxID=2558362 RepID=A0A4Y8RTR5_9HYPH|nr:MlaE family lipid ABC transporter permease subunit [Jiella endophytica]TFF27719.1 MlaE family lipid ABC transporter permease subunit [Jiella endophytica]
MLQAETPDKAAPGGRLSAVKPLLEGEKGDGGLRLMASGDWLARTVGEMEPVLSETTRADLGTRVVVDCSKIGRIDTAGAFVLERLSRDLGAKGREAELAGVSDRDAALFKAVREAMDRDPPAAGAQPDGPLIAVLTAIGRSVYAVRNEAVGALNIIGGAIYGAGYRLTGRTQRRPAAVFNQVDQMGVKAIPIIVLITFLIGGIIAQQGAFQLRRFGGEVYAVNLVGILVLREIGVLLTAIMIAGRSGSAITAEIGSMKMREEIDALHVIGLNPIGVLVFPRLVALTIALPLLTVLANLAALLGGMLTLNIYSGISFSAYLQGIQNSVDLFTVFSGLIKAPFMAIVIGIVGALEGMKVGGSAESLGLRVTASVVKSIFLVIVMDGLFAIFYASIGL